VQLPEIHAYSSVPAIAGYQLISTGVPMPLGVVKQASAISIHRAGAEQAISNTAKVLSLWPDGSIRWLLLEFAVPIETGQHAVFSLRLIENLHKTSNNPTESKQFVSGDACFAIDKLPHEPLAVARSDSSSVAAPTATWLQITNAHAEVASLSIKEQQWRHHHEGQSVELHTQGELTVNDAQLPLQVTISHKIYHLPPISRVSVSIHNPAAARHPQGIWDLGDTGSVQFSGLTLGMQIPKNSQFDWTIDADAPRRRWPADGSSEQNYLRIEQHGSGGSHWNSPVHVDASGQCSVSESGYRISSASDELGQGARCSPSVSVASDDTSWSLSTSQFWQRFPKALEIKQRGLELQILPVHKGRLHELQGGESCSFEFQLVHAQTDSNTDQSLNLRLVVPASQHAILQYAGFPASSDLDERYSALLAKGLYGEHSFKQKREAIDEFGWRHFGELYADHETWNQLSAEPLVSHYNNQYDVLLGFAHQYLLSGDSRWYELMDDLARHIMDIDVYRTELDRAEYNHGLFWHTDHYVSAGTATHRTYSKLQQSATHQVSGGGPGGQHCYTGGLRAYFLLTGNARARETVLQMTRWIDIVYQGSGSLFECVVDTLKRDLPTLIKTLRGQKVLRYRFPLDRGVGNYIRALLDCFELEADQQYIDKAGDIIRETIGPLDDMNDRDLADVENTWFYTIFLQALVDFLDVKQHLQQHDTDFHYARDCLLHYASWMVENEVPNLESRQPLEFRNDTWVAQDSRKAAILHAAYRYAHTNRSPYLKKARFFKHYVLTHLEKSDTAHYTRIQAILLQNHNPVGYQWIEQAPLPISSPAPDAAGHNTASGPAQSGSTRLSAGSRQSLSSYASVSSCLHRLGGRWWHGLRRFSLAREIHWLKFRLPQLNRPSGH